MKAIITAIHWTDELCAQFGAEGSVVDLPDSTENFLASIYNHGRFTAKLRTDEAARIYKNYGDICAANAARRKPIPTFEETISKTGRLIVDSNEVGFVIFFENDYD